MLPGYMDSDVLLMFKIVVWLLLRRFIKKYSIFILSVFLFFLLLGDYFYNRYGLFLEFTFRCDRFPIVPLHFQHLAFYVAIRKVS